jgi:hypothetical protein
MPSGYVMIGLSLYVLIIVRFMRARSLYIFTCGLLRCSSFDWWAMRDALRSGTSNWYSDPHFFVSMYLIVSKTNKARMGVADGY